MAVVLRRLLYQDGLRDMLGREFCVKIIMSELGVKRWFLIGRY